jgi:hypothetical protein
MRLPWRDDGDGTDAGAGAGPSDGTDGTDGTDPVPVPGGDPVVSCAFQDGTIAVYDEGVHVDRPWRSRFDDVWIPIDEVDGVDYATGILVGHLQVVRTGVDPATGGLLSDPVDENTVHFGRGGRDCASEARDAIRARLTA